MNKGIVFFIFLFTCVLHPSRCQEFISISGKILDSANELPLPFAQISVINTTLGTAANTDGYFRLAISKDYVDDSLIVYYLGYGSYKGRISDMITGEQTIRLNHKIIQLSEVEIFGLNAEEVIRRAVARIPENYGAEPLILTAFLRVQKMVNNRLAEFTEAIIEDRKDGYYLYRRNELSDKYRRSDLPNLLKGRVKSDTMLVNSLNDIGKNAFCLSCYFTGDLVEYYPRTVLDEKEFQLYQYHLEEQTDDEGKKIYHITFDQKDKINESLWKGEFFITASEYAIEKIIIKPSLKGFDSYEKKKYRQTYTLRNIPGWVKEMPLGQTVITYSKRDSKWSLNTIRNEYWMTYMHPEKEKALKYGYKDELVVTDICRDPDKTRNYKGDKSMGINQRWDQLVGPVDETFWMNYNYLPVEEILKKAIESIPGSK